MEVRVPDIGDFTDVPVIEILVEPGQEIAAEDPTIVLESDKATMEIPSPAAGVVGEILVKVGDKVSEGTPILELQTGEGDGGEERAGGSDEGTEEKPAEDAQPEEEARREEAPQPSAEEREEPAEAAEPTPSKTPERGKRVVVIGAGPGGYTAAFRAADLGLEVTLVERYETLGGVCLNVGCIPSKALLHVARTLAEAQESAAYGLRFGEPEIDLDGVRGFKQATVKKLTGGLSGLARRRKVEVVRGSATFTGPEAIEVDGNEIGFDHCIIATGSQPARLPFMPDDPRIMDSTSALELEDVPERLLVIGGGIIGLEMATVYEALGSKITVVELLDQLIPGADADLIKPLHKRIADRYEDIHLGVGVTGVEPKEDGLTVSFGEDLAPATFDRILVAVGRKPNGASLSADRAGVDVDDRGFIRVDDRMRTNVEHIYAIGDVIGEPMLAHKATHEGKVAAEVIAGHHVTFDARSIPAVAYTDPEVAWTGLTETRAKEEDVEHEVARFPWAASGRALSLARSEGLTKLLVEPDTHRVLGAGIVGVNAGELIAEVAHALEMGAVAEDLGLTIHPHPTLSETVGFAAEAAEGTITDL